MWRKMIDDLAAAAEANTAVDEHDYVKDGLLYCYKCNTPKQWHGTIFGEERLVFCDCKCVKEQREREEEQRKQQARMERLDRLRSEGFTDAAMRTWTFENDDGKNEELSNVAHKYVENFPTFYEQGMGLLLFGGVGTGKSFITACIANALIDQGRPCLVTNFPRIVNSLQNDFDNRQEKIDRLNDCDLLVIDDFAVERQTEYVQEIIYNVIDSRYRIKCPLIITTNLTAQEIANATDIRKDRIYSRLKEMTIPIEAKGVDRRRGILARNYAEMAELLGLAKKTRKEGA